MSDPTPRVHPTEPHISYRDEGWEWFNTALEQVWWPSSPWTTFTPWCWDFLRLLMEDIWPIGDSRKYGLLSSNASLTQTLASAIRMSLHLCVWDTWSTCRCFSSTLWTHLTDLGWYWCVCVYVYICICVYICACMCVCMCSCVCACTHMCISRVIVERFLIYCVYSPLLPLLKTYLWQDYRKLALHRTQTCKSKWSNRWRVQRWLFEIQSSSHPWGLLKTGLQPGKVIQICNSQPWRCWGREIIR